MARQPRLNVADGVYHVTQRGLERRHIALNDDDRLDWFRLLDRQATRCGWRVFAYALLDNHFHLFVRTPQPNLSEGMQAFESGFVTLFNKRHKRIGPLFQGRFGAVLVEYETYARELSRYVHLNPYRAGLDTRPGQYEWCSYRYYLNPLGAPMWLDWQAILSELSQREAAARIAYKRFIDAGIASRMRSPLELVTVDGLLGSERFVNDYSNRGRRPLHSELAETHGDLEVNLNPQTLMSVVPLPILFERLIQMVAVEFEVTTDIIRQGHRHNNWARRAVIWLAYDVLKLNHREISKRMGDLGESAVRDSLQRTRCHFEGPAAPAFRSALSNVEARLQDVV